MLGQKQTAKPMARLKQIVKPRKNTRDARNRCMAKSPSVLLKLFRKQCEGPVCKLTTNAWPLKPKKYRKTVTKGFV
jgi:hypothetical protein